MRARSIIENEFATEPGVARKGMSVMAANTSLMDRLRALHDSDVFEGMTFGPVIKTHKAEHGSFVLAERYPRHDGSLSGLESRYFSIVVLGYEKIKLTEIDEDWNPMEDTITFTSVDSLIDYIVSDLLTWKILDT